MTSKTPADVALDATWILPVAPRGRVYRDCSLLIKGDNILAIVPSHQVDERFEVRQHVALPNQLLMPGLVNCHGHSAMTLLRGFADDLPLDTWLQKHVWPAENRLVNEDFVADGARLAIGEMLLSGTTCFSDMYFFPEVTAQVAHEAGIRTQLFFPLLDFANNWSRDAADALHKGLKLRDTYRSHPLINVGFGPHAPYTLSDASLQKIATYAEELQAPVQIHLHETAAEVEKAVADTGQRPIERLENIGLLGPLTQCVHMTQVTASDIERLTANGAHVIHCPESNMKLASGACPVAGLLDAGVNVALGTDGAASNNDLDMLAETRTAALLAKLTSGNPAAVDAATAIELATLNGAKALGQDDRLGSLEAGKQADVIAVDLSALGTLPVHQPLSQLVYSNAARVKNVWVAGRQLVRDSQLTTISAEALRVAAGKWQQLIQQ